MSIWKTEYLRHKYFFGTIFCVEFLLDLLRLLNMLPVVDGVDTVYSFWQMLSWIGVVALTIFDFFNFFYLNHDRMLHLLPVEKSRILFMKSVVFGSYMMLYFVVGLVRYLILLPKGATTSLLKVASLYICSKVIAVLAFLTLLVATLVAIKKISNKVIGAIVMSVLLGGIISFHAYGLFQIVSMTHEVSWTIGIVDGAIGINQYANILPIVFTETGDKARYVEENFYVISLMMNGVLATISWVVSKVLFKTQKYNYVED